MDHKFKKIIASILAATLVAGIAVGVGINTANAAPEKETNKEAKKVNIKDLKASERYTLTVNEEDLSIVITDKETGKTMESAITYDDGKNNNTWLGAMKSAVVVTMINGSDDTKQADLINDNVTKDITYTDNGFSADLFWTKYGFGMTLEVALTDEGLIARIPDESIVEKNDKFYIGTISVYPFLGNSYLDDKEGYMLIPDGNGALIYLNDKEGRFASGYSSMIYGKDVGFEESNVQSLLWGKYSMITDAEKTMAPIFGIAHTDDKLAYLGIVEDGCFRASIEAAPNGAGADYNRAYAKFIERKLYKQPTSNNSTSGSMDMVESDRTHSDLQVRYIFLSGDEANYAGMANAYRDYLLKNNLVSIQDNSYKTRIDFLGTERESFLLGTKSVVMTTNDDIREIYSDLGTEGVDDIFTVYKGWQSGGLYKIPITSYSAASQIGGTSDLTNLINEAKADGIDIYLYNDALTINPDERNASFNVIKKINKRRYEENTYKTVYKTFNFLTPARTDYLLNKFLKSYTSKGVDNLAITGITNNMFAYTYSGNTYDRADTAESYSDTIAAADEKANLSMEQPFAYLWNNADSFLDMPLYTSSYVLEDESVPFLSIVLKGVMPVYSEYVNFEANKQEFFLKMIETGTFPSFYITKAESSDLIYTNSSDIYSTQYDVYKKEIIEYTNELKALDELVNGSFIKTHDIDANGVTKVTYDNGVKVYINYSSSEQTVDGVTIPSMSYEVVK